MPPKKRASRRTKSPAKRASPKSPSLNNLTDEIAQRMRPSRAAKRPKKRATSRLARPRRVHGQEGGGGGGGGIVTNIFRIVFLVGCVGIALYLVAPPGAAEYIEDGANIITMDKDYDGKFGPTKSETEAMRKADPEYKEGDTYGPLDLFAPKNDAMFCAIFWEPCRDWHFVHGVTAVLMVLMTLWSLVKVTDGKVHSDIVTTTVPRKGIWGMCGCTEKKHTNVNAYFVVKRRSLLLAKLGCIIIAIVSLWSAIDALGVLDFKGVFSSLLICFFAWHLTTLSMKASWKKKAGKTVLKSLKA